MATADEILEFWFQGKPAEDADALKAKSVRWYAGGPAVDRDIVERFGADVHRALAGELDDWARDPRGRLALVLLLDQFSRNVFRDSPRAYEGDAKAQRLAVEAFDQGLDRELSVEERQFLMMPLLHSEDLALQERACQLAAGLAEDAPPPVRPIFAWGIEQTKKYRDIIARFGRFPHRNKLLGRTSSQEEEEFIVDWDKKMPPSGARSG